MTTGMHEFLRISEAASIALHSMVFMAARGSVLKTGDISTELEISEAHLSKVLQRLAKHGLVRSLRGPRGGYIIAKPARSISLRDVYEAIEGSVNPRNCLTDNSACINIKCIMGDTINRTNRIIIDHLTNTRLSDFMN